MNPDTLNVALAERSYPIHFSTDPAPLAKTVRFLRNGDRKLRVITDANLASAQPGFLHSVGIEDDEVLELPSGESTKSPENFEKALRFLAQSEVNRDGALIAFGGGVTGDLAGFVAASYLRGIDYYQVPTTLLSMVDSSVGGKTGINLLEGKNLVGAFWQPKAVFIHTDLLQTLPAREFSAGMAEVIKYGLLADEALFEQIEGGDPLDARSPNLAAVIRRCCEIKAAIVADDEKETAGSGGRALLNLGHTFAHAIEAVAGYGQYLHGEAVAIGLVLATRLSIDLGQVESSVLDRVIQTVEKYSLPSGLSEPLDTAALMQAMQRDKKTLGGKLRFVTLKKLGQAVTTEGVATETVEAIWRTAGAS